MSRKTSHCRLVRLESRGRLNVTVLVDRLDHAVALAEKLPTWPIIGPKNISLRGYPARVRRLFRPRSHPGNRRGDRDDGGGQGSRLCFRHRYLGRAGPVRCADSRFVVGGAAALSLPPLLMSIFLMLSTRPGNGASAEEQEYEQKDFYRVGIDPVYGRIQRFLKSQKWRKR